MFKKMRNKEINLLIESKDIDPGALFIIQRLNGLGYEALVIGGCIRNLVMRQEANDWDVTTEATTEEITKAFKPFKVISVGKKYGTVTVVINSINYQVTNFRGKGRAKSKEQLDKPSLTSGLFEDLRHRDFTINVLAWGEASGLIDYFNGLADIKQKMIRCVEEPGERIKEDALRMLRAVRLACELDFEIDKATLQAIEENSSLIKKVSPERIRDEFTKILLSNLAGRGLILLQQLGLWSLILPVHLDRKAFGNILNIVDNLPSNLTLRLSALLYPGYSSSSSRRERSAEILKKLRFKNSIIKKVTILVQEDWQTINFSKKVNIRQLTSRIGMENLEDAWELKKVLARESQSPEKSKLVEIERGENNIREIMQKRPPVSLKDLAVNGKDLFESGYKDGKEIGKILKELLNLVLEKPELNQKEILLNRAKEKKFSLTIKQVK